MIRDIVARWVVRQDRRLSPTEATELQAWLAANPLHAAAFEQSTGSWHKFRELGTAIRRTSVQADTRSSKWKWIGTAGLAAAAALVLAFITFDRAPQHAKSTGETDTAMAKVSPVPRIRRLPDGSVARLKLDAEIAEAFSAAERRIRLVRGEVFFAVAKDPARPFLVEIGNVTVRAVGTAFSIRYETRAIEVLVTEGTVTVTPPTSLGSRQSSDHSAQVSAGHRAVVSRAPNPQASQIMVTEVSKTEIAQSLAWSEPMLDLAGATLGDLVTAYEQRSGHRIVIADPTLSSVRIGGRFPADDVDGFVHLLAEIHDVKSERRTDGTIVLRRAP